MAYKKPQIVAKSTNEQVFVAAKCENEARNINIQPVTCRK